MYNLYISTQSNITRNRKPCVPQEAIKIFGSIHRKLVITQQAPTVWIQKIEFWYIKSSSNTTKSNLINILSKHMPNLEKKKQNHEKNRFQKYRFITPRTIPHLRWSPKYGRGALINDWDYSYFFVTNAKQKLNFTKNGFQHPPPSPVDGISRNWQISTEYRQFRRISACRSMSEWADPFFAFRNLLRPNLKVQHRRKFKKKIVEISAKYRRISANIGKYRLADPGQNQRVGYPSWNLWISRLFLAGSLTITVRFINCTIGFEKTKLYLTADPPSI